ncbi:unnamed protein product [Linum tenue]|uniref:Mitochondrial import inner membrane translocase subunit Tim21 n=1 Tax=Linum tenue TaxID=586396 RepID=A0AAV0MIC7_9ROSI|nr:unnamed protein product [Linum tenue]
MQGVRKSALLLRSRNGLSSLLGPNPAKKCLAHIPMPSKSGFLRHFTAGAAHIAQDSLFFMVDGIADNPPQQDLEVHANFCKEIQQTAVVDSLPDPLHQECLGELSRNSPRPFQRRTTESRVKHSCLHTDHCNVVLCQTKKDVSTVEDPFDAPTYNIPEKPVTFTEGASYTLVILVGLGLAAAAGYAVFKELIFEPKEYKIFNMALKRIQDDGQVRVRIGSPITGYGQESRNRAARQRIPNKIYTDEDGVEHVLVSFHIRGPHGAGKVSAEMFRDKVDKQWKYTYLIVQITHPSQSQLILESYIPAAAPVPA